MCNKKKGTLINVCGQYMNKEKVIISCDTTIALSKSEIIEQKLNVIPLNAIVDGVEYHDSVDIDAEKLAYLMRNGAKVTTSTPTIVEIENYFNNLFETTKADVIIHFTISSKLSSMFSLFTTVCKEKYGDKVIVVDSLSICLWMHQQVTYAINLANQGYGASDIVNKVEENYIGFGECVFVPESIEYLKRGGRISPAIASIANFIGVLPILTFKDGEVGKKGVTRTMQKAFINAFNEWKEKIPNFESQYNLAIISSDSSNQEKINKVHSILKDFIGNMNIGFSKISLNVTAHTGPGTIGIGIIKKDIEV